MDKQSYLSNLSQFEVLSLREISKRTGLHFNTVKKYVDKEGWNESYKPRKERGSLLDTLKPIIDEWIAEDLKRARKYRRTGTKIYNDLRKDNEHSKLLQVGKQSVINYVSRRKQELSKKTYSTAMFGLHSMCEAQVDFGKVLVVGKDGSEEGWHERIVSFPWSNAGFAQVCRYETKECLCEALQKIFEFIGGVPLRILFDNMSSAVVNIEEHGKRTLTEMFMRFTMHHRFKAEFCNPDSPQEKGNVENKVGYIRRNCLLPPPVIEDLDAFNRKLLEECMMDLQREHYVKKEMISELFAAEQEALIPLPRERFRVFTLEKVKTDKYSFIHFDKNRYSTSPEYTTCEMWLEIGVTELRILNEKSDMLASVCKQLHFGSNLVANAKKIKADDHLEFLLKLFTAELEERDRKRRNAYMKAAKFDIIKTFEKYTFEDIKFPKALTSENLTSVTFIPRRENLILYGNVGAGKTHLAIAVGVAACDAGYKTRFWRTAVLVNALTEAKRQGCLLRFMKQFEKLDLLICDEWGYVPIDSDGSKLLFQVISECYERKSLIITTNLEFARWNDIFADTKITAALLDRIIHHSHLPDFTNRDSRRLRDALLNQTTVGEGVV